MASPKSINLILSGWSWLLTNITLSGFMSVCRTPMLQRASRATNSCTEEIIKKNRSEMSFQLFVGSEFLLFATNSGRKKKKKYCNIPYLLSNRTNLFEMHRMALSFLEQIVEIIVQHFKHQTGVSHVLKLLKELDQVAVVGVELADQLQHGHLQGENLRFQGFRSTRRLFAIGFAMFTESKISHNDPPLP